MNIALATYGEDSLKLSPYINNLGRFYKDVGRYEESERLLLQSLELEKKREPDSSNVADRINNRDIYIHCKILMIKPRKCINKPMI